ncbi:hypothetical protein WICPIJ_008278 [Wickerhamomyces pijperi]|uniref:Uncharacterized protein n=1 Tax=Wickerhamomyces pijperi TaxID=599730 RepID=A0A9P8TIW0_WICPI|nr:hypothetical protein WICPIJ_008278 [Wickerhamomyces pijperi]
MVVAVLAPGFTVDDGSALAVLELTSGLDKIVELLSVCVEAFGSSASVTSPEFNSSISGSGSSFGSSISGLSSLEWIDDSSVSSAVNSVSVVVVVCCVFKSSEVSSTNGSSTVNSSSVAFLEFVFESSSTATGFSTSVPISSATGSSTIGSASTVSVLSGFSSTVGVVSVVSVTDGVDSAWLSELAGSSTSGENSFNSGSLADSNGTEEEVLLAPIGETGSDFFLLLLTLPLLFFFPFESFPLTSNKPISLSNLPMISSSSILPSMTPF